ncbi:Xanthine phosphoribosyltransferase [[Flavobacterium] thermophilum]|nr:Xanthine phosphoribosyltransferase [[Flavobacterium] thermophilum]
MRELLEKIAAEGEVLAGGVLKVDRFLNHQSRPAFDEADWGGVRRQVSL